MQKVIAIFRAAPLASMLAAACSHSAAVDSISFETGSGSNTKIVRLSAQWKWERQWWRSNGTHIGGYWDLSLDRWREDSFQNVPGNSQNITVIGITPIFRFQNDSMRGFYAEAGIGAHFLSALYDNSGKQLSTRFQFGDHIGVGYMFPNNLDISLKFQHFSNGGIKQPNNGVNFSVLRVGYAF